MKKIIAAVVLMLLAAPAVHAQNPISVYSPNRETATRLQPVVGSVKQKSHFTNPFTHKAKYTGVVYNPTLGNFGTQKFRK